VLEGRNVRRPVEKRTCLAVGEGTEEHRRKLKAKQKGVQGLGRKKERSGRRGGGKWSSVKHDTLDKGFWQRRKVSRGPD